VPRLPITVNALIELVLKSGSRDAGGFMITAGTPEDRGIVLLIDQRLGYSGYRTQFSSWWRTVKRLHAPINNKQEFETF
ncbi:uncharacterized protein METZ01_LOCUS304386, partial [marine metagenome]